MSGASAAAVVFATAAGLAGSVQVAVMGRFGERIGSWEALAFSLFLIFWALVWRMCSQIARSSRGRPEYHWAYWLAQMNKVSIVAYLVGGAFLNLAYWDVPYYLFVAAAITRSVLKQAEASEPALTGSGIEGFQSPASAALASSAAPVSVTEQRAS